MSSTNIAHRQRRRARIRSAIRGTGERPRLSVFRSNRYIYAQLIDDETGKTLASASTLKAKKKGPAKGNTEKRAGKVEEARSIGTQLAEDAKKKGITKVVFDRGGYRYHGRVRAVADGAREGGLTL